MVQHIVLWTFKEGVDKPAAFAELEAAFAAFKDSVPGMRSLVLHRGYQGYDVCLISLHDDRAALDAYQAHPEHIKVKALVKANRQDRASCDFELPAE